MIQWRAIDLKLLRDLRRLWAQTLAIALVLGCGVAVLLMSLGMSDALDRSRTAYYERNAFADIFARATRAPRLLLEEVSDIPGIRSVEARVSRFVILDLPGRTRPATVQIVSIPEHRAPRLNVPVLQSGRWPDPGVWDEVVVNAPFAEAHGYRPGDRFAANLGGTRRDLRIVGTALSPEFIYTVAPGALMPDPSSHGVIWMTDRAMEGAFDMTGAFDDLVLALDRNADPLAVIDAVDTLLDPHGGRGAHDRDDQISHAFLEAQIDELRVMAMILPPVFLLVTVFLVNMVIGRIVALERAEIGLLKAVGYSDRAVLLHYLTLAALVALCGIVVGWAAGTWLARWTSAMYARFYDFPELLFGLSWTSYALGALTGLVSAALGASRAALSAARLPPAVAMAPAPPPRFRRTWLDRLLAVVRLPQTDLMILRAISRWPVRSGTAVLGYALATAVLVAPSFFQDALDGIIDLSFNQANRQDAILLFPNDVQRSAVESVRRLPGVLQAEPQIFASVALSRGPYTVDTTLTGMEADADLARVVQDGAAVVLPESGITIDARTANKLSARLGDRILVEVKDRDDDPVPMPITGIVPQILGTGAYMSADAFDAMLRRGPRTSLVNVTLRADREPAFHEAVKMAPSLGGAILLSDNRRSFQDTIAANMNAMALIYIGLGAAIAIGVAYNGARIQLSERARELASLRILGFGAGEVSWILIGETMLLAVLAQPLGWWIGHAVAELMADRFSSDLYNLPLVLTPSTYARASLIALAASLAAVLIVRRRVDDLDLVAVMKTRE
ncbi:ABC transporter permease [Jannaschia aquimarina]|uniref:FtsX-like permease family protein n=1 Tax=Jannaschia aquimarina TaxID=935700 RepID=A0A0D1EBU4_9RHOB|nr:ABC transporter permease [Jannaschia aquimarina]KIT14326.1 FtsX-like permease family protein [Jannaschia aquimarina]SNS86155.1 putative ABC transport system permease protein [Jannaschia aquimarina]